MEKNRLDNVVQLLERAAEEFPDQGITVFGASQEATTYSTYVETSSGATFLSHRALFDNTKAESRAIQGLLNLNDVRNRVVVLHTEDHLEGLHWFWAIVAAGGLPCISPPLSNDLEQRRRQIGNLYTLFSNPVFLTNERLRSKFDAVYNLTLFTFREVNACRERLEFRATDGFPGFLQQSDDTAVLMLTSGSTGDSKAVALKHKHILAAVKAKSDAHGTTQTDKFLNWTGLDHVANLTEIHLHALSLGADQFHMPTANFLSSPSAFLQCISKYRISYAFAPNFFLGLLKDELQRTTFDITVANAHFREDVADARKSQVEDIVDDIGESRPLTEALEYAQATTSSIASTMALDISSLRAVISGGEANVVETCVSIQNLLSAFGAPTSFIRPGFGMTETCAGCIYNVWDCPRYDVAQGLQFACLGEGIPGLDVRISQVGELQLRGSMVFEEYYQDPANTKLSFTADGWFRTGDIGCLTEDGRLCLTGRDKDMVIINGVSIHPQAIENAIDDAKIPNVAPTYNVVFAHRPDNSSTEAIVAIYLLDASADPSARISASREISKTIVTFCGVRPFKVISLGLEHLQKSALGKLSRSKLRKCFESGEYAARIQEDEDIITGFKNIHYEPAHDSFQVAILESCEAVFETSTTKIGINHDILQLGLSSIDLLRLKMQLQNRLEIVEIPIITFFSFPVVKDLATQIMQLQNKDTQLSAQIWEYDPIVTLQPHGDKTPLFLFHPGLGEILVFMNIARYITDRPVYAVRARGFDNEPLFKDLDEVTNVYYDAIKRVQPEGPYAFAGYSFGSFLAFEITKLMTAVGDEVRFLATIDQAPFCKERARTYDWYVCCLSVAFFLDLIKEDYANSILPAMRQLPKTEVLDHIFTLAPASRIEELSFTKKKLDLRAQVAFNFKTMTSDYDPVPGVKHMDVFYTEPLIGHVAAKDTKEWFESFISRWDEVVDEVKYHEVSGGHRALISPPNIGTFQKVFRKAMADRGV